MKDHADGIGTTVVSSETIIYVRGRSSLYYPKNLNTVHYLYNTTKVYCSKIILKFV